MPRVFICYKCGDASSLAVIDRLREAAPATAWFLDRDIPVGHDWQRDIATALHDCHAAVVLLSRASLAAMRDGSRPWISAEILVLQYRTTVDQQFLLLPLLCDDLTEADLVNAGLGFLFGRIQAGAASALEQVASQIRGLGGDTPVDRYVRAIAQRIAGRDTELAGHERSARHLLGLGSPEFDRAFAVLSDAIPRDARAAVLRRTFPFTWIHPGRTRNLPPFEHGRLPPFIVSTGDKPKFTPEQHTIRARMIDTPNVFLTLTGVHPGGWDEEGTEQLMATIGARSRTDLEKDLTDAEAAGWSYVLVTPPIPALPEALFHRLTIFPATSWFILVGASDQPLADGATVLDPPLTLESERRAWQAWDRLTRSIAR